MTAYDVEPLVWVVYHLVVVTVIGIDLAAGIRRGHGLTVGEASRWVALWIGVGVSFGLYVLYRFGVEASATYYAAYALEYTLSIDNLFVFAIIFMYFAVPSVAQPIVLYVGIISAIIMRATFIYGGLWLLETFHWTIIVFGAVLLYTGVRIWKGGAERIEVEHNPVVKWVKKLLPITNEYSGAKFIIRSSSKRMFTPLIMVLLAIESSDIMFAFDSVPAALALTQNFFIAYTSNISAILGLRSLYFLMALTMLKFKYIGKGLALILVFLGAKFFLAAVDVQIPTFASIGVIFAVLATSILASSLAKPKEGHS